MGRLDQLSWADFTVAWETDVKAGLYWLQAALNLPLKPGSRVLVGSSGAAVTGSPMSGGYGGAKRMLWFMAKYANGVSEQKNLGIRFQAIVPQQIIRRHRRRRRRRQRLCGSMGITPNSSWLVSARRCRPERSARKSFPCWKTHNMPMGFAFGLKGDPGSPLLEGAAA
jgi:hypothetical protein